MMKISAVRDLFQAIFDDLQCIYLIIIIKGWSDWYGI